MSLLVIYVLIALVFSFLCSIAEAVFLSINQVYVTVLEGKGRPAGPILRRLKQEVHQPLAAILSLNTIAHTVGAVGAGAQAARVFGDAYLGIASAILTLLILVFSEIIPKTIGANYWRQLAPLTAHALRWLVWALYPFVKVSELITGRLSDGPVLSGFSRQELKAIAQVGVREGQLDQRESQVLQNLLALRRVTVRGAMTPRTVVFSVPDTLTAAQFFVQHQDRLFSRIVTFHGDSDTISGFVLRSDLLLAVVRGEGSRQLQDFVRPLMSLPDSQTVARAFAVLLNEQAHIGLVVNEYGEMQGIFTLEDIFETLLGLEIVDESDDTTNMQELARRLWRRRAKAMGIDIENDV